MKDAKEAVFQLFRQVANERADAPRSPHVLDNEDLLARWEQNLLTAEEHEQALAHLAECAPCRGELADMIRGGFLELPEPRQDASFPGPAPSTWQKVRWVAFFTLAASLFVGVGLLLWPGEREDGYTIALAALERGDNATALAQLEKVLDENADPTIVAKARETLERAGYQLAKARLNEGDFVGVRSIEDRLTSRGVRSSRIDNLVLQADAGEPAEYTLALSGSLTRLGYGMDGTVKIKSPPAASEKALALEGQLRTLVDRDPNQENARLNLGFLLLKRGDLANARAQFEAAATRDNDDAYAHLGLGLVDFMEGHFEAALEQFRRAGQLDPTLVFAPLNAAICLERLGRTEESKAYWHKARALTSDAELQGAIERRLQHSTP